MQVHVLQSVRTNEIMSSPAEKVFDYLFCFEAYGVPILIESNSTVILSLAEESARKALLGKLEPICADDAKHVFRFEEHNNGECSIFQDGQLMVTDQPNAKFFRFFDSLVRILVAEFSEKWVFIHSGVVGWKDKAILIPGDSFAGKTCLVASLIRAGCTYFSDEYAVLDGNGSVHTFPRKLTMRNDSGTITETDVDPTEFGGAVSDRSARIGAVWFTKFDPGVRYFRPERQTTGNAVVDMIKYTIPIRRNPAYAMEVLRKSLEKSLAIKCLRGDASKFVPFFLEFIDNTVI